jgi:hypothetical protein
VRYDNLAQQYIYNLATKGLALANYMVIVRDAPSPATSRAITLKKYATRQPCLARGPVQVGAAPNSF